MVVRRRGDYAAAKDGRDSERGGGRERYAQMEDVAVDADVLWSGDLVRRLLLLSEYGRQ